MRQPGRKDFFYRNIGDNFSPAWQLTPFEFENISFGGYSQICFNDIDGDTDTDILIGNVKGGIYFYKNTLVNSIEINPDKTLENDLIIETFPNPFNSDLQIFISVNTFDFVSIDVYNILGEKIESIYSGNLDVGKHQFNFNRLSQSPEFSSGTYFIVVRNSELQRVQKILLLK
ncbi:T9SS type A sorting domain-containing protein [Ignavibacterium sp.]|uniref:T9SS type A sorting domain-containing protein n=1 Tax=Ignavibacterium sp. TaxID=2651167 RepID=UPI00307DBC0E